MAQTTRTRLQPEIFDLPVEKMRAGWYTDAYFNHARDTLLQDKRRPRVVMQIFQKNDAWLGGMDEAIAILKLCANDFDELEVHALFDGDRIEPYEPVMHIEGDYTAFAHLETPMLGTLARRTLITTNVVHVLEAADGKPIIFMPARHDHHRIQTTTDTPRMSQARSLAPRSASQRTSRRRGGAGAASARCRTRSSRPMAGTRCSPRRNSRSGHPPT
jgi:nicotinate phosphoribosyltransferase